MASTKEIKRRIKSVKSTKKITKAMELVAASKMKRAVSSTLASRLYAEYSWEILTSIAKNIEKITHPLFIERETKNILLFIISSNRGLCGAYNTQIIKKVLSFLRNDNKDLNIDIVTIGKKGDIMMRRIGKNIIASFFEIPANISISDIVPISEFAINEYNLEHYDKVFVAYTDYISAISQKPNIRQIIPVSKISLKDLMDTLGPLSSKVDEENKILKGQEKVDYLFEGDQNQLIGSLAEKITRMQIYQMLLESNASEQSSRMIAMKNASDAAGEMIDDLTLVFNKARQSNITKEISEISAGMASAS
ncbi:MAG: ATP synthase gamma chain [Candidatus Nomurabacteria bacterium GW2011_GWE1_32_28]|uniref:ATP synthase gamma chain n=1 Tax=Candidatus Nomurabacteria bacterium GW2011_GWF1_31_48 TaxID=1618767 RepID=A0A0G0AV44_9BACT|nr:MAG: ATP synthase gamma chain [Candidatus Nomurabacteria bacterium GW2011_GWF2_30_133]KKP29035.1 MAG: ATP synthase gamma chain [Candidatus Nomurabacteria bacterium GW2011_GWE2_31_40]KKP30555.1 MAG: ATP synthase gamma chain [Candidatus Nomurabacteria bacterium GW2011_GWF1_31_48]KKP35040.1 MAG: ATP synthase gamma chain [Candidatus Nomurabacteria bacterium GW2011_GWE1_32_28]HAS80595.1 ATP synthase F1 subunit gamma [Candidatus Nomurabacteria bacterium]